MMATKTRTTLEAEPRIILGKKVKSLRREGKLPGRVFGHGDSIPVQIDTLTFSRLRDKHETAGLIDLNVTGQQPLTVLVRHIEHQPKTGKMLHVDFFRVQMNETLTARVPLKLIGESEAAKFSSGSVIPLVEAIEIVCLPSNLPDAVEVDVSKITSLDIVLHASDISLPQGVTLKIDPAEPIVKVQPPRGEAASEAATAAPAAEAATPEA